MVSTIQKGNKNWRGKNGNSKEEGIAEVTGRWNKVHFVNSKREESIQEIK